MSGPTGDTPTEPDAEPQSSEEMARADVANGERPEHPVGQDQAETNRDEESPA